QVRAFDLVYVVIDRQLGAERHVQPRLAVDLDRVEILGKPEIVGVNVGGDPAGQGRLSDGVAHFGIGIELGEVEGGGPAALADVVFGIVILAQVDTGPSTYSDRGAPSGEADPHRWLGDGLVGQR